MSSILLPCTDRVSELLEPLTADLPCGKSLRYEPDLDRLRDLRREDDTSLPTGVWKSDIKRADWSGVEALATTLLLERSKDLMVAVWLGEAWLHKDALLGITDALALVSQLCARYPQDLHPQAEDGDQSWRVTPLDWLARRYGELLHTQLPLLGDREGDFAGFSLFDWQQMQRKQVAVNDTKAAKVAAGLALSQQNKFNEQVRSTPLVWWLRSLAAIQLATKQLAVLESWSDLQLQELAPTYVLLQKILQSLTVLFKEFIAMHPPQIVVADLPDSASQAIVNNTSEQTVVETTAVFTEPRSREEAYRQLLLIADYLGRTEPHSPVPYLIKRGVEWGNKPLKELLSELISADPEARRLWTLLGVL
ncbi:type VI secretion system protein TssA [Pseudomonas sp. 10B1]|uniref:type VI secretion system protein TssA n=2 Tax=Pseudomonadota TaxID=1224 RepID=UPI002AB5D77A|nr:MULTISPECIES: type VI secretion system protein TssA [unclassified Pseudomonas]MDY7560404.1 type VI secretion system protein TssA [Pseudomonas sp. AB6]MEA9977321.1 type VI secretion system protein TssA [Pseudomonas sp. RTS4]MEA9994031.1 type VI secretion system protein TssA [Pseudomonas sp. AA4]MEB0088634.1 type VI secretion system protein TssA [Pseudomonas sp. RTI1]MEB0124351.1 type VI secretion system protein TssA [Pseudomonas sp. CCC1.2]